MVLGVLLVMYREQATRWITQVAGGLFIVMGAVALASYYGAKRGGCSERPQPAFPLAGIGSAVLGVALAVAPQVFINAVGYIFAAALIAGALSLYASLASCSKHVRVGLFYWLLPTAVLVTGAVAIIKPSLIASMPFFVIGWAAILYGVAELLGAVKRRGSERQRRMEVERRKGEETIRVVDTITASIDQAEADKGL